MSAFTESEKFQDADEQEQLAMLLDEYEEQVSTIASRDEALEKADRHTAEQEAIISKQREIIAELEDGLRVALEGWEGWMRTALTGEVSLKDMPRIEALTKLVAP